MRLFLYFLPVMIFSSCSTNMRNQSCGENPGQGEFLVFIGEKILVEELPPEEFSMDGKYVARFKVLEVVCGNYSKDTIEFIAYDHYGTPRFADYQTSLLYVIKDSLQYYHSKYMYDDLYRTKDGRWASPYSTLNYDTWRDTTKTPVHPVQIQFAEEVSFDIAGRKKQWIKMMYPTPYYRIEGGKAIAVYGNYVDELFLIKKEGVLSARGGLFGDTSNAPLKIDDVELQPYQETKEIKLSNSESGKLITTWKNLYNALISGDADKVRELSIDTVTCSVCEGFSERYFYNDREPLDTLIYAARKYRAELLKIINPKELLISVTVDPDKRGKDGDDQVVYAVSFESIEISDGTRYTSSHVFYFIKKNGRFVFVGVESGLISSKDLR